MSRADEWIESAEPIDWFDLPGDSDLPDFAAPLDDAKRAAMQREKSALVPGLRHIGKHERATALFNCCNLLFAYQMANGHLIEAPSECHDLICPSGMRAKALRHLRVMMAAIEAFLFKNPGMQGIMVTLTLLNCASADLAATVDRIIKACGELMQRRAIKRAWLAWIRALELTRNPETHEWHVHVHLCVFVDSTKYFRRRSKLFVTVQALRALWRKQLKIDYDPMVDIRMLRGILSPLGEEGRKSLREILKYVLKPGTLTVERDGQLVLIGTDEFELYDPGDGQGLRWMDHVPLRAVCDALRSRRTIARSRNLQATADLDFTDDPDAAMKAARAEYIAKLGRFRCMETYLWHERGGDSDYLLVDRSFDEPTKGGF